MSRMVSKVAVLALFIIFYQCLVATASNQPVVHTKVGIIRGRHATDGNYSMFVGIPYGKVDEANPFGVSKPHPAFETEFEAYDYPPQCPQVDSSNNVVGSLDCLGLNVYVPHSATSNNKLPVLVWFPGGHFQRTRSYERYGPKYLVRHDVILITFNFRVGVYGYMCLQTPEVPGNQGLKDQTLALRWIKSNIGSFNGDANKITLMGQSAGGRSVDFHVVSSKEPLFHNVIFQSGTSLTPNTIVDADTEVPLKLANHLGFNLKQLNESLGFVNAVEPKLVVEAAKELNLELKPCVEKVLKNVERSVKDYTFNLIIPQAKNINVLMGHNTREQLARYLNKDPEFYNDYLNVIYNRFRENFNFDEPRLQKMVQLVHKFYLGDKKISPNTMMEISELDSNFLVVHSTQRSINMYRENGAKNIFYYIFSYNGARNVKIQPGNVATGSTTHSDEIPYLFDVQSFRNEEVLPADQLIIDRMTTLWTNFAKYGNPTPEVNELLPVKWLPVSQDSLNYYNIDTDIHVGVSPFHKDTAFWDLFYEYNWKLQKGYRDLRDDDDDLHNGIDSAGTYTT